MGDNYYAILWWFLPYININRPCDDFLNQGEQCAFLEANVLNIFPSYMCLRWGRAWCLEKGLRTSPSVISREDFHPNFPDTCLAGWCHTVIIQCVWVYVRVCACVCGGVDASTCEHADTHMHTHTLSYALWPPLLPLTSNVATLGIYVNHVFCPTCSSSNSLHGWVLSPETSAQMSLLRRSPPWPSMEDTILTHCQSFLSWLISFTALKKIQGTWMGREVIILSKVGQKEKDKYRMTSLVCGTWNLIQMNLSGKQNHRHRKQIWGCQGGGG